MTITLFYPFVNKKMKLAVFKALGKRIIGEGDTVKEFEKLFEKKINRYALAVNSGTSALELAYHLLDLKQGDEVICPVFTCTATTIPLVRRGIKVVFADVTDELLLDFDDVKRKITTKTKAVVNVHLFGKYNKAPKLPVPVIGDSAQYIGKTENELFTIYSLQATKIITTVDGGVLVCKRKKDWVRARLLRWYGIDREASKPNIEVDIKEAGYFFGMNNIDAAMGIEGLKVVDKLIKQREKFQNIYKKRIGGLGGSPYLIHTEDRELVIEELKKRKIEAGLVHMRNDTHTVFGGKKLDLSNMNLLEDKYLFLPCHNKMKTSDVRRICRALKAIGWELWY